MFLICLGKHKLKKRLYYVTIIEIHTIVTPLVERFLFVKTIMIDMFNHIVLNILPLQKDLFQKQDIQMKPHCILKLKMVRL